MDFFFWVLLVVLFETLDTPFVILLDRKKKLVFRIHIVIKVKYVFISIVYNDFCEKRSCVWLSFTCRLWMLSYLYFFQFSVFIHYCFYFVIVLTLSIFRVVKNVYWNHCLLIIFEFKVHLCFLEPLLSKANTNGV